MSGELERHEEFKLVEKVRLGDSEAFHALFSKYQPVLYKTIYFRAGDADLAEDIAQETFVRLWLKRGTIKPDSPFFPLANKIAMNLLQDHYKHKQVRVKHQDHVQTLVEKPEPNPEEDLRTKALEAVIHKTVNEKLPDKCRTIFILSRVEGLSNQAIAAMLDISKKTVENQLYHALKVLKAKCADYL